MYLYNYSLKDIFFTNFAWTKFYPSWSHIRRYYVICLLNYNVYTHATDILVRDYPWITHIYHTHNIYILYTHNTYILYETLARRYTRKYGKYFLNYAKLYIMLIITLCACGWAVVSVCIIRDIVNRIRLYIYTYIWARLIYDHCTHK